MKLPLDAYLGSVYHFPPLLVKVRIKGGDADSRSVLHGNFTVVLGETETYALTCIKA